MSGKRSKKNQRPGSSRRGPEVLNSNIEKDDEQFQQIAESEDGRNEFHTSTEYHSTQFDHPPSSSTDQQTSALECPPHARGHKDSLMENKLPEQKRKMGSTRKRIGRIKDERKLDEIKRTGEFDEEYVTQPNTSTTEEQHASLTEEEQSRSMSFPSDLNLQTKSSELRKEPGTTLMLGVLENEEKDTIHYQEITFNSHEVLRDIPIDEKMVPSVHSIAVTVAESDLLQKDSVMFDEPSCQDIPIASTSRQKRRICSTRRPLGEKNRENVGVQEHSSNIRENKSKAEVLGEAKFPMSEEMEQTWDGVARDVSLSHTESALVLNQSLLAERAELKEPDVSAGTETMNKSVTFPLVDSEKPLPETSSQHGTPSLNEGFDFNFGSHTGDFVNKVWKEAESDLSDNSQCVLNTSKDTNTSYNFTDVNTEAKEKVLKQKEELSINYQMSDLLPKQDAQLEELELNYQEYSLSQHDIATLDNNCGCSMAQLKVGGSRSFNVPVTNISHAEPTATNLPHEMSDAFDEKQEIQVEIKQESNVCDFTLVTCDTLTDLECIMEENEDPQILAASENENTSNQRGSETDNALKITDQHDVRDHNVIQTIMDVRDNEKDAETSTETIWISHQKPCEVPAEKEELNREQEQYSSNISRTQSPLQDAAGKMLETDEVRKGRKDTENAASNDVTTKSEEMFSFKLSATVRGSHAHQQLFMQYPDKEGYDSHENVNEKSEEEGILVSVESENASFDRGDGKSEGTKVDAEPVVMSNVEAVYNDSESANPEQNRELALKVSTNAEKEVSGERDTIVMQSDINLIPEEAHSKSSPVIYKRKMGSTRRPLRGKKGQKIEMEHHDENETLECEGMINLEKKTFSLEDESITNASLLRTTKDGVKVQDMELCEDNDVGPVERSESALLQSSCRSDFLSEESTAVSICHVTESQTLMKLNEESQENAGDAEKVAAEENKDLQLETESQNKISDTTTYDAEGTEEKINDVSVTLVREVEVTGDTGTVESNMTTESDLIQNDTSSDPKLEAIKVSDDAGCKVQEETVPKQSDTTIIPHDTQKEEAHSEFTVIHKRKMGSTRRPHRGKNGQRKEKEHRDENETPYSEDIINVEKETISLEDESITNASLLRTTKDGVKEQDMELCEDNDVGPVERSESALLQSSCRSDFLSEESTAVSICHITESQTLMKLNKESQENAGDAEKVAAEENKDLQLETESQNKISDTTSYEAEGTEEKINDVSVTLIREVEVTGDTGTVESNMTMESDLMQNDTSSDAKLEAIKVSDNTECEVQEETDTVPKQSDTTIIPQDTQKEEAHSEFTVIHKRKMGSTRRPLRGKNRQRKEKEHHDENETPDSEDMINVEKETISLEDESITNASLLRTTKDGVKVQDVELCEDNDVGPVERSESALLQSSCRSDFLSEESTAVSICHVTESQTLMKLNKESQENAGDAEKVAAEENKDLQLETESQNKISDTTTYEAEGTEENINDVSVTLVREVEVTGDTGTGESNMTMESDLMQNDTSSDAKLEAIKVSDNTEREVQEETIPKQSDTTIIPQDAQKEEAHSEFTVIHKRKMGSTRRPLRGKNGQRKEKEHHDENETLDSEDMINVEEETISLEDEPPLDESALQSVKLGAKEQEMDTCKKNDVGPVERSKSTDMQSSCSSDLTSEESIAINICHITESQTPMKLNEESQENVGDADKGAAEEGKDLQLEIESRDTISDTTTYEAEGTDEKINDVRLTLVREVEVTGDTGTGESNMTTESDLIQNDTSSDPKLEAIKVSDDAECKVQEETVPKQSDTTIIPHDTQKEEAHSEFTVIHKRKMGSTRRPLRGKNRQRKEKDHHDENKTPDSEDMINVEKETISLEDESITNASLLRTTKDGIKVQDMELCEDNYVGPVERSESALLQSSCRSDFLSEESTAVSICHITESQTLMKLNKESQENAGDAEKVAAEENKDLQLETESQNKISDTTTYEAEGTEENINDVSVTLVREVEITGDTGTVESNLTTESDFLHTSPDVHIEALKISENVEKDVSGETDTVLKQSDINLIPEDSHTEEAHSKSSPVIQKRKMGSTRRPLRGNEGQRQEHDEKEIFMLKDEPSPDESRYTAVSVCDISESQTLPKIHAGSQENSGDVEIVPAEEDTERHLENQTFDSTAFGGEATEENICEANVLDKEVEFIGDTVTLESNITTESDLIQNDTSSDPKLEAIKVSDDAECKVQEETVPKQSDTTIIPHDNQKEEAHSEFTVIHKRKMGSTRRPLRGKNTQRKEKDHHDENETPDSEDMINVEKETISLEDESITNASLLRTTKDGVKVQDMELCEDNDVGPVERSESALLQSSCRSDFLYEESTAVSICHVTESQTLMKLNKESQENAGDAEKVAAEENKDLQLETESQNKIPDTTSYEAEGTEEKINDVSVTLVGEVEVTGDTGTVESNMTMESDLMQNDTSSDAKLEAIKVYDNTECEVQEETDTVPKQSDTTIIPQDAQKEEAHSEFTVIHKRKMGSTRRPLRGKNGQRKEKEHHDENETLDSEDMINVEEETISLEDEPPLDESTLQSVKLGAKEQEMDTCKKNDVGPVERSKSTDMQSSCSSDLTSEESIAINICHITESQTPMKLNEESQENVGDADKGAAEDGKDLQLEIESRDTISDTTTYEAEGTDEKINDVRLTLVREVEVTGDTGTVESNMTMESDLMQNDTSSDAKLEAIKVYDNTECEVQEETDTVPKQSDTTIIPQDAQKEEAHSEFTVIHKRKMGSTRRPLRGKNGQRKEKEHHDENETLDSEDMINVEEETISLEDEPPLDESTLQSVKLGAKEQEMDTCKKNDVGPVERSKSTDMQSSCSSDLTSEESIAINICHITESQTPMKLNEESQENVGDADKGAAEEGKDLQLEIESRDTISDTTTYEAEGTDEKINDVRLTLVREVEVTGDTGTVESNITTESGLIQNDTSSDAKLEAFKVSDNAEREVQKETDTVPKQSDTTIIPQDAQKEEAHSEFTVIHKRKMGSTRRPLRGKNRQRKEKEHHDENETLDSEDMINVEEETISLEDEPPLDESTLQSVKLGAKEQEMDTCKKNDVGPVERSKSTDLQSSCSSDLTSEESIAINICHITESQTLMKLNEESQENAGDAENVAAEENKDLQLETESQDTISDTTTYEAEGTEEKINDVSVTLVGEVEVTGDTGTGEINMTTESDLIQNDTSSDAKLEAIKVSEHAECEVKEETDTFPKQSDTTIIPQDTQKEEAHSEFTVIHKRKMGSTRRPLRGKNGQRKVRVESEEDTKAHLEVQYQDNVVDHIETQEFLNIRDNKDEDRKTTETVDMSVQEPCDDLELKQRSDVSQTQSGPSQDDTGSHLFEVPERTADFVRDRFACRSHSALILSDALLMEETQMYVSSENAAPTEMAEMHPFSKRSMKKRKMGSTRKRGKRMVNDEEVEEEKEGEAENTTNDDGTTKSEENLTIEEAIAGSPEPQQLFISSADREGHEIQDIVSKSDVQTDISEQNYPNSSINPNLLIESECSSNVAAEMISDFSLGYADTYLGPKQIVIVKQSVIPKESHREDQSSLNPVFQKRKMGSTRKTLRGNKGQGKEESKKMDRDSKEMTQEQDTEPHLATSARKTECKFDEKVEQNFPVDFSHPVASSKMCPESENGGKEVSPNIHDLSEVSEEKGMESTGNDSNSENEAINLYDRTKDKFVLKVNNKDVDQTVSVDVYVGSEPEQTENTGHVFPTQELKSTQDDFVNEISSTQEKRRKMGSTRRNPKVIHGENMADNADALGVAENSETKKAEDDLDDMPLASSINQSKEVSSVSTTDLESEMLGSATDLKEENDHQNNSEPSGPTVPETPENTLQLVNADVTKHPQSETVTTEKRRKMGSTRKNLRAGRNQGIREGFEETETTDTNLQMPQDSEMSLGDQTSYDYSDQSEDSLLSEIERALNKTSQSSMSNDGESIIKEPKHIANAPDLNMQENSEIKSLQPTPLVHSEPNSPGGRRRKMGSTRKNSRQQLKAEREDEDKEDGEKDISNLRMDEQEIKDLERVEVSIVPNITENKLNKEYLDVSSAHTSSSQLEESANPVCQERTSPSTKRKFGSRRANKSKQGLSSLATSDFKNELEDGDHKADKLCSDVSEVCDPCLTLQPENQPITHPVSEQRNMEAKNEEAAPKATGAGPVSLGQIIKPDRSTGAKQTVNLNNSISDAEEVQFNVVMVGNCSVGKTSFIRRFHEGQFTEDYRSTIGVDTCIQTVALPDRTVKLQIWDTAGQERFHSITTQVFHRADGLLLMYAITCSNSFISVRDWISRAQERAPDDVIMMLLGNKNDSGERAVQIQEGADLAREYNINFMECSAATGANVSESMTTLAELLMERKSQKERHATLRREPSQKKSGCC
ncbi:uncharacterized protein LOC128015794 isoform X5 [Carassius gibelio]|uniref:uncharacterized protein LOC128015794 isoform X4 n=1 Tax=Carassius gibelio TaxID=101364 RepID=UPI0022789904|nr:uncharacterized protein LOC128015794 isoform X4 [Carassius gibelio]XP_052455891.1 uncharacterized protein LOC128015794 isoform X5 [Carassius gibelio]